MHAFSQIAPSGTHWPRVLAAAHKLSLTGAVTVFLSMSHPSAGATSLIVASGILSQPEYLVVIEAAVIRLTKQAWVLNHLAGLPYPIWAYRKQKRSTIFSCNLRMVAVGVQGMGRVHQSCNAPCKGVSSRCSDSP
jgi:hypothetical protein